MSEIAVLSETEIQARLAPGTEWVLQGSKLFRRLVFEDFVHAFGFMTQIAMIAEKIDRLLQVFDQEGDISNLAGMNHFGLFVLLGKPACRQDRKNGKE